MSWLFYLLALAAGAANPFQSGANAQLNKQLHHPLVAGAIVYSSGLAGLVVFLLAQPQGMPNQAELSQVSWWAWLGGLVSIASTLAGLTLAQKMGAGIFTGCSLTASLLTSVVLDQFGLLGFRQHSASLGRLAGCCLLTAGIWLVARF